MGESTARGAGRNRPVIVSSARAGASYSSYLSKPPPNSPKPVILSEAKDL